MVFRKEERMPGVLLRRIYALELLFGLCYVVIYWEYAGSCDFECPEADDPSPLVVVVF